MFENVNEVSVLVSAILAIAIGSIWYSPLLFGKYWMRAAGLTENDLEMQKQKIVRLLALAIVVNLGLFFIIAQFVELAENSGKAILSVALFLTILISGVLASAVIWEEKPLSYLLINISYAAVIIFGGMSVIWYWPW